MAAKREPTGYPYWAYPSRRAFKAKKRRDLVALEQAFEAFRVGVAYTPLKDFDDVATILVGWRKAMSAKSWGR